MTQKLHRREAGFDVVRRKTFRVALATELKEQIPSLGKLTADRLAEHLEGIFHSFFPPAARVSMGQVIWPAVAKEESHGYGKRIEDMKLTPVVLTFLSYGDLEAILAGTPQATIRRNIAVRLFNQAYEQGGVLAETDVAAILGVSLATVCRYVTEYEKDTSKTVPRRGTIHDIGPSVTHKREICYRVVVLGHSVEQTARDTNHSPEAVTRYVVDYRRVLHCLRSGFSINETAFATKLSPSLVSEYDRLQHRFNNELPPNGEL